MSFHRPITSALEATECLGSLVNSLIGTRNSLKCILEDGETAFIQDVNLLLQHLQIEHPVGQYVVNACHSFSQRIGTGTKTLLLFTSLLTKAASELQYQGIPLSVSLPIMQTCLDACVEHLKEVIIPVQLKFHPQKTVSGRGGLRQEISEPCCQKGQVLFREKERKMDEDMFGIENSYFKTDTQRVDAFNVICHFERKSDCDKCFQMTLEEDNSSMSTGRDGKSIGNQDKHQFIDVETSNSRTLEFSDNLVNIPTEPTNQEIEGLDTFSSKPEDKGNREDQGVPFIHLQMRGIHVNVNDDDDDDEIGWFFESGWVEADQESDTEKVFLQNHLLKVDFSISHHDVTEQVEKREDGIGKENASKVEKGRDSMGKVNVLKIEKRGNHAGKENILKVEEGGDGIGKENVSNKNILDEIITSGSAGVSTRHDSLFSSKVTRCKRNSDSRDSDSEFDQCFDDTLSARREIDYPQNSFDRNKDIDGCCVTLEKAGDLCQIDRKTNVKDTVVYTYQSDQIYKMQKCIGSEDRSAMFDGHSDKINTTDDVNHEFDVCFEFDHSSMPVSKDPLVLSASEDKASPKYKDQILPVEISLKGVQTMLDELKVRPKGGKSKYDSKGHVCLSGLKNSSRHFKTMDSSLKAMTEQIHSKKHSVQTEMYLECSNCTNLDTTTTNRECSKCTHLDRSTANLESSKCIHLDRSTANLESSKCIHLDRSTANLESSKCIHLGPNTTDSLKYYDTSLQCNEDDFLTCLGQVCSQLHFPQKTKEGTKGDNNFNDFGNSRPKMVSFQRCEFPTKSILETDFTQPKNYDDIQNIHRSRPKLVQHSRHLNIVDHKGDDKSYQRQTVTISKAVGKNRDKATSDICSISEVNCLREFKNQTNRGLEKNLRILFDSKMSKIENDGDLKNSEFVNKKDHSSLKQISQKKVKISNNRIDSLLQEGENNVFGGRYKSEISLTEALYSDVHFLVSRLGHTNDKDIIEIISRAVVYQSTLPTDSFTSRFDVKKVYCHTIQNSLRQTTDLVNGLLLSVSTDQMILISQFANKPCRALMVNGTVSPTFQHVGHKTSMQGPVFTHTIKPMPTNQWLQDVRDILQQLRIDVILSKGPVCEEVVLLASELHVVVIENIPFKALQALSVATEKELAVYVDMAAEVNICQVDSLSPWRTDWMDHGKTKIDSHFVIVSVDRNILQTAVISQPCQGQADIKEQEFWQCASRVASSLNFGSVIPGGGRAEEHCMKICQEQSDNIKVLNEEKSLFQSVIWEAMAIVFNEFASTVKRNTQQSTFNEKVPKDVISGSLFDSDASDNQNPDILDDYASKMAAWKTALEIASNILQLDMYIVTGITRTTKSNLVVL